MAWSKLISTELTDDEKIDMGIPCSGLGNVHDFPYGMHITMDAVLLKKLGLSQNCEVGDYLDMRCFASVTSVRKTQTDSGDQCRVELTIEKIAVESEMAESTDSDDDA